MNMEIIPYHISLQHNTATVHLLEVSFEKAHIITTHLHIKLLNSAIPINSVLKPHLVSQSRFYYTISAQNHSCICIINLYEQNNYTEEVGIPEGF